jgi:hypothetical protein
LASPRTTSRLQFFSEQRLSRMGLFSTLFGAAKDFITGGSVSSSRWLLALLQL